MSKNYKQSPKAGIYGGEKLHIGAKSRHYPIYITGGFGELEEAIRAAELSSRKAIVVTDSNVAPLFLDEVMSSIGLVFESVYPFIFLAGEISKTMPTVEGLLRFMIERGADRLTPVFALGGGVCGDMAGFAASIYMRGIPYAQIPTTLLSMVDSSIGGKTGVDFAGVKNLIGTFNQPNFVYANVATLSHLPRGEFLSGMGEAAKHGIIGGGEYLNFLRDNADRVMALDRSALSAVISGSCRVKGAVIEEDEREANRREMLNFGHTFGHAIETDCAYTIPHGQCVAIGMLAAINLSVNMGRLKPEAAKEACALLSLYNLPTEYKTRSPKETTDRILGWMYVDKKSKDGRVATVVLDDIGKPATVRGVSDSDITEALKGVLTEE